LFICHLFFQNNNIDSSIVDARPTPLSEARHRSLWPLQITITLTESSLVFCLKNCGNGGLGIEPTTLDLSSQSSAYDLSAMATPDIRIWFLFSQKKMPPKVYVGIIFAWSKWKRRIFFQKKFSIFKSRIILSFLCRMFQFIKSITISFGKNLSKYFISKQSD